MTTINPRWARSHPVVACTSDELARLRAAYRGQEPSRGPVAERIQAGEEALRRPVLFPPRGGQHNQWYQCDKCQMALNTVDDTHHQCPRCQRVYTGEPYDDVLFSRVHNQNLKRLYATAWAYAVTDDPRFAEFARGILLGYAERYRLYPYHSAGRGRTAWDQVAGGHLFEQTLNEASSLATRIAPAYDLIHDAPLMTSNDHARIREGLLIPMLENIDQNKAGKSNWQTWHNAAMLWGGAVLRDEAWVAKALAAPGQGFVCQMKASLTPDGMWYENSWGYHFYTLTALIELAEGARRLGIDLWSNLPFQSMFTVPIRYLMPDGHLPRFGDDVGTSIDSVRPHLEIADHAFGNETLLPYLTNQPTWNSVLLGRDIRKIGTTPPAESALFPGAGHAILRTAGKAGLATAFTFGPYGGAHGHFDKLSFVFYGQGMELGVDPGRAASQAYRLPIHKEWYKATISHNAVLVDGLSQAGVNGDLMFFVDNKSYAAVRATCRTAYPGTQHQRLLLLTPSYLLVFDQLDSDAERRFDWLYHNRGESVTSDIATHEPVHPPAFPGCNYMGHRRTATADDSIRIQFKNNGVVTHLVMDAAPATDLLLGDGPGASVEDRIPLTMITRRGKQACFAAVLEPVRDTPATVTNVRIIERNEAVRLEVRQGDATDVILLDGQKKIQVLRNGSMP